MTETTGDTSAPSAPASDPSTSIIEKAKAAQSAPGVPPATSSAPSSSGEVLPDILSRLSALEAQGAAFMASVADNLHPRLQALEEGLVNLAARAASEGTAALSEEIAELRSVVHAIAGSQFAHDTTSHLSVFQSWWQKISGKAEGKPATPTVLTGGGGSVTNESLAAGGAAIPLQPSTK